MYTNVLRNSSPNNTSTWHSSKVLKPTSLASPCNARELNGIRYCGVLRRPSAAKRKCHYMLPSSKKRIPRRLDRWHGARYIVRLPMLPVGVDAGAPGWLSTSRLLYGAGFKGQGHDSATSAGLRWLSLQVLVVLLFCCALGY